MFIVELAPSWRVRMEAVIQLPVEPSLVWHVLSDFERFACTDLFHERLIPAVEHPVTGIRFSIIHRFLGIRILRAGRILRWQDGRGYAFSDLSQRNPAAAFPHIYSFDITPDTEAGCAVTVRVSGRWTTRFVGRFLTQMWLRWIFLKTRYAVENAILARVLDSRFAILDSRF